MFAYQKVFLFLTCSQVRFCSQNDSIRGNGGMIKSNFIQFLLQEISSNPYLHPFCLVAVSFLVSFLVIANIFMVTPWLFIIAMV
jgi:preprotein translocase subunit Sec61beta